MNIEEYKSLRQEILHSYTIVDSSRNILYITVAYILTFATGKNNPLLYILPFVVIIPVYLISINYTFDMYRIGTYIMIFCENDENDLNWENRQLKLNKQPKHSMPRQAKIFHIPYISLGVGCSILFYASFDYTNLSTYSYLILILGIILQLLTILIFLNYQNMILVQEKYIKGWIAVKEDEQMKQTPEEKS